MNSAVVLRILQLIHEALVNSVITTKRYVATSRWDFLPLDSPSCGSRDIYYKDPALFQKQSVVDRYVDHLAFSFGVRRVFLNVVSSSNRGLEIALMLSYLHRLRQQKALWLDS